MSYLDPLRLSFAGKFKAAPSTVNNDVTNFNIATFQPSDRERGKGGAWNPAGDAVFRLFGCAVTSAFVDGAEVVDDPVISLLLADTSTAMPGKIVDLDPEQQLVSQIWGFQVRLCDAAGKDALRGAFEVAPFIDLWSRDLGTGPEEKGDFPFSTFYQSVLTNLKWSDDFDSKFLQKLKDESRDALSIHFIVDSYCHDFTSANFTLGRIVGTIGPHRSDGPKHFTLGRYLAPVTGASGNPIYPVNFCTAVVNSVTSKLLVDLGNALPTVGPLGPQKDIGALTVGYQSGQTWKPLGTVDYMADGWYTRYAGISAVPSDRALSAAQLEGIENGQIVIQIATSGSTAAPALTEATDGQHVRADQFVFRVDPGDVVDVDLWLTQWGKPLAGGSISVVADPSGLQTADGWPDVATPATAIHFPGELTTKADGRVTLPIEVSDPGNPRKYIDGQVYGIRVLPASQQMTAQDPSEFISLLLLDEFKADDPVTWYGSMQPIFLQYFNLYPVMDRFLNLSNYEDICVPRHLQILRLAFGLDPSNPNSMPVTRDLSRAKRKAILQWLTDVGPDGKPRLGTPPTTPPVGTMSLEKAKTQEPPKSLSIPGGKALAMSRRLSVQRVTREEAK
jgi:hypothetical protein